MSENETKEKMHPLKGKIDRRFSGFRSFHDPQQGLGGLQIHFCGKLETRSVHVPIFVKYGAPPRLIAQLLRVAANIIDPESNHKRLEMILNQAMEYGPKMTEKQWDRLAKMMAEDPDLEAKAQRGTIH